MRNYSLAVEDYREVEPELMPLWREHCDEVGADLGAFALAPDSERYRYLTEIGWAHLVVVRLNGQVVGYHMSLIHQHLHYKFSKTANTDVFFLKKEHRKGFVGIKLFRFVEKTLEEKGVQRIYTGTKLKNDIGRLLERVGFNPIERLYTKVLMKNLTSEQRAEYLRNLGADEVGEEEAIKEDHEAHF